MTHNEIKSNNSFITKLMTIGRDIKLSHSIFAMPFALLACFLAADGLPKWEQIGLIVACMFFARTYAMLANRYFDREIDKQNPRTAGRALPAGKLKPRDVMLAMIVSIAALLGCAYGFAWLDGNWWPLMLSPIAIVWLGAYGLMKRFTFLCHVFLGGALALSPIGAAVAIDPSYLALPTIWLLSGFVLLWVAGFDVIYALQDLDSDMKEGVHSIPAKFGVSGSLRIAKFLHILGVLALIFMELRSEQLGEFFLYGIGGVGLLLIIEHHAAMRGKFSMAFFTLNGVISCVLGGIGIYEILAG